MSRLRTLEHTRERTPVYDAERETIPTNHGTFTIAQIERHCDELGETFAAANLRPAPDPFVAQPDLEARMADAARARFQSRMEVRRVVITSDWSMMRHPSTGVLVGRARSGEVAGSWPEGHCTFTRVTFEQEHDGTDFGASVALTGVGSQYRVSCDSI